MARLRDRQGWNSLRPDKCAPDPFLMHLSSSSECSTGTDSDPQPGPRLRLYLFAAARAGASGRDICMKKRGWLPCCRDGDPGGDTGAEGICRQILPAAAGIRDETRSKRPPASGAGIWQGCRAVADGRFDGGVRVRRREGGPAHKAFAGPCGTDSARLADDRFGRRGRVRAQRRRGRNGHPPSSVVVWVRVTRERRPDSSRLRARGAREACKRRAASVEGRAGVSWGGPGEGFASPGPVSRYSRPAPRAHLYFAPSTCTGISVE